MGANVNVVTKSGSNDFHGTVFEFFRNNALNANSFRNKAGQPKGVLKQNQFGFRWAGRSSKTSCFFVSYQGMRQINGVGSGVTSSFFSPPFTNDRSRAALGKLFAGQGGLLEVITVAADGSNISTQALNLFNLKLPNGQFAIQHPSRSIRPTFAIQGFSAFSVPASFDEDQFLVNVDYLHTEKSKLAGRFFFADSTQSLSPALQVGTSAPGFRL
jgi:hypothetical protein